MAADESPPAKPTADETENLENTYVPPAEQASEPGKTQNVSNTAGPVNATVEPTRGKPSHAAPREKSGSRSAPAAASGGSKSAGGRKITQLGDFKLVKKLGQGGMGTVYLARQVSLDRPVALKTLSKELAKNPDAVERFLREARSMAKLSHSNIVQVYAADSVQGFHFAALEYIDGQSMQDWMDAEKRISVGDALHIVWICADALRHAHEQNMVHRDIKPDNILLTKTGIVKVSDFGLAKALDDDLSVTQSGTGLGTPLYMSPEQARNAKHVDSRSDIYSLGCTLYYFLTGELPFTGESALEVVKAKEQGKFVSARRRNPDIPDRLDLMIDKMIAKNPAHRYDGCRSLIRDIEKLGLANPTLSFLDHTPATSPLSQLGVTFRSTSVGGATALHSTTAASTNRTGQKPSGQTIGDSRKEAPKRRQQWYVSYQSKDGKHHLKQMTTQQVIDGLRSGLLNAKSKAKTSAQDPLLPLAQFPEFVQHVEKQVRRERTSTRESRFQQMFEEVEQYERRKKWRRFFGRLFDSAMGWVGLVIWLGVIVGVGVGLYFLLPIVGNYIADYFGLR